MQISPSLSSHDQHHLSFLPVSLLPADIRHIFQLSPLAWITDDRVNLVTVQLISLSESFFKSNSGPDYVVLERKYQRFHSEPHRVRNLLEIVIHGLVIYHTINLFLSSGPSLTRHTETVLTNLQVNISKNNLQSLIRRMQARTGRQEFDYFGGTLLVQYTSCSLYRNSEIQVIV